MVPWRYVIWKNGKNFLDKGVALDGTIGRGDSMGGGFFWRGFSTWEDTASFCEIKKQVRNK